MANERLKVGVVGRCPRVTHEAELCAFAWPSYVRSRGRAVYVREAELCTPYVSIRAQQLTMKKEFYQIKYVYDAVTRQNVARYLTLLSYFNWNDNHPFINRYPLTTRETPRRAERKKNGAVNEIPIKSHTAHN